MLARNMSTLTSLSSFSAVVFIAKAFCASTSQNTPRIHVRGHHAQKSIETKGVPQFMHTLLNTYCTYVIITTQTCISKNNYSQCSIELLLEVLQSPESDPAAKFF